jgi:hypothetical protein
MTTLANPRREGADDPDDPLALPLPPHTVLLDDWTSRTAPGSPVELALRALRQQALELGLQMPLAERITPTLPYSPSEKEENQAQLVIGGFRVQLVCTPFWSDALPVPSACWHEAALAPHLLLAAWVDRRSGAVHVPGVLTASEALAALPELGLAETMPLLPTTALLGGIDRLFSLVQLLEPTALALPQRRTREPREVVPLLPWLEGTLGAALAPFAPQWIPAEAHAFRSGLVAAGPEVLVAVAIPLALVAGRVCWGGERRGGSERFQLRLSLRGRNGQAERLEVRLEPNLPGDLLPEHLALVVGDQSLDTDTTANQGPLVLSASAGEEPIEIRLVRQGVTELQLPPMILATPSLPA